MLVAKLARGTLALALLFALLLPACGGGGSSKTSVETRTTTLGQELIDLQKAHQSGAISTQEYERQRAKLLEKQQ